VVLLQPALETFERFNLLLHSDMYVVCQGHKKDVLVFFESLSFKLPPRKGVINSLQEVFVIFCFLMAKLKCFKKLLLVKTWYFHNSGDLQKRSSLILS